MKKRFKGHSRLAFNRCLYLVPYKTGKLRHEGVKYQQVGQDSIIYVDLNITPYAEYINGPGYRTKGWFNRFCRAYADELKRLRRK